MEQQTNYSPLLADPSKQYITADIEPVERVIVAAANYHREREILLVGSRHWSKAMHNQLESMGAEIIKESSQFEQGFIDQYDQFITREEAKSIALVNGQPLTGEDWGKQLFSENLY